MSSRHTAVIHTPREIASFCGRSDEAVGWGGFAWCLGRARGFIHIIIVALCRAVCVIDTTTDGPSSLAIRRGRSRTVLACFGIAVPKEESALPFSGLSAGANWSDMLRLMRQIRSHGQHTPSAVIDTWFLGFQMYCGYSRVAVAYGVSVVANYGRVAVQCQMPLRSCPLSGWPPPKPDMLVAW